MTDDDFLRRLSDGLEPCGHVANLHLAWLLCRRFPVDEATARMCDAIGRRVRPQGGTPDHELTARWTLAVAVAARRSPSATTFEAFLDCHPHLLDHRAVRAA